MRSFLKKGGIQMAEHEIFFNEDHKIEITIKETHHEKIHFEEDVESTHEKRKKSVSNLPNDWDFPNKEDKYSIASHLHCSIKYYIDNTMTPIIVDMGNLLHITSYISDAKIITTGNMFAPDNNVDSLKLFTHHLASGQIAIYTESSEHSHKISYQPKLWTHQYCGVSIKLFLTEKSTKIFIDEFVKLLISLDAFYINHFSSFQRQYSTYLDITAPPIIIHAASESIQIEQKKDKGRNQDNDQCQNTTLSKDASSDSVNTM